MTIKDFFQIPANWIKSRKTPVWLRVLLFELQNIITSMMLQIGKAYLEGLEAKIIEVENSDMSGDEKWQVVFTWGKENIPDIKNDVLNLAIELLLSILKKRKVIK